MPRNYSNRFYLLIKLPQLTSSQFNNLVNNFCVQTSWETCFYSVDPVDGKSRFSIVKLDGLNFDGDEPAAFRNNIDAIQAIFRRKLFLNSLRNQYSNYFPPEDHNGIFTLVFSNREVTLDRSES